MQTVKISNFVFNVSFILSINDAQSDKLKTAIPIIWENVNTFEFTSDIDSPVLVGKFAFEDSGNVLFGKIGQHSQTVKLYVNMEQQFDNSFKTTPLSFDHVFQMSSYKIVSKELTKTTYSLEIISTDWDNWCNHITLAGKDIHSKLIQKLLSKAGFKMSGSSITSKEQPIDFVTPTNFRLLDSVNYILDRYWNQSDGITYLKRNFINRKYDDNDYTLKSTRNISDKQNDKFNLFMLQTPATLADELLSVRDFKEDNYHNHEASIEFARDFNLMNYDYASGAMKKVEQKLSNFVSKYTSTGDSAKQGFGLVGSSLRNMNLNVYYQNSPIRENIKQAQFYTTVCSYMVRGMLARTAGDMATLIFKDMLDKKDDTNAKYAGNWLNLRVYHQFTKKDYWNFMQVSRLEKV